MKFKKRITKLIKSSIRNESGNVMVFAVTILFLLILITSVLSLLVLNRVSVVRAVADNSKVTSSVEDKNANVENAIMEIVYQSDELTRYYISNRYYQQDNTDFAGSNAELDGYLKQLVSESTQTEIYSNNIRTDYAMKTLAQNLFIYFILHRDVSLPGLKSFEDQASDASVSNGILMTGFHMAGINGSSLSPTYHQVTSFSKDKPFLEISYQNKIDIADGPVSNMKGDVVIQIRPYAYQVSSQMILIPGIQMLKSTTVDYMKYIFTTE